MLITGAPGATDCVPFTTSTAVFATGATIGCGGWLAKLTFCTVGFGGEMAAACGLAYFVAASSSA